MNNVIRVVFNRQPLRRVLFPSVVPMSCGNSTPEHRMVEAFMTLGLIVSAAVFAPVLAYWIERFAPGFREDA